MLLFGCFAALLTGLLLGLIGGGGSILIVPVLVYLFQIQPPLATAYSLFIVGIASLFGSYRFAKKDQVDMRVGIFFALPSLLGVFTSRRFIVPGLPEIIVTLPLNGYLIELTKGALIMSVFGCVMLIAARKMIQKQEVSDPPQLGIDNPNSESMSMLSLGTKGFFVGLLTGFVGAGGGFIIIPTLVLLAKMPMKIAIGTSLMIIGINSLIGFLGDIAAGQAIDWGFLNMLTAIALLGIFLGSFLGGLIPAKKLKPAFGWFVLVMAVFIIARQLIA